MVIAPANAQGCPFTFEFTGKRGIEGFFLLSWNYRVTIWFGAKKCSDSQRFFGEVELQFSPIHISRFHGVTQRRHFRVIAATSCFHLRFRSRSRNVVFHLCWATEHWLIGLAYAYYDVSANAWHSSTVFFPENASRNIQISQASCRGLSNQDSEAYDFMIFIRPFESLNGSAEAHDPFIEPIPFILTERPVRCSWLCNLQTTPPLENVYFINYTMPWKAESSVKT